MMCRNRRISKNMRKRYAFTHLSRSERQFLEAVLAEEVELQTWYAVAWSGLLGAETLIGLQ
jgi:hypothetical protein